MGELGTEFHVAGIYLFSEGGSHLYVGRSDTVWKRLAAHSQPSSPPGSAAFAFRLSREATGRVTASYKQGTGTRSEVMADPAFRREFDRAKARVRSMDVGVVKEPRPVQQALLEIYAATVLGTPYNSFENH
jgi:hypothetical protein